MTHSQSLQFEVVWKEIAKTLKPLGKMPDKASLDQNQILDLYSDLMEYGSIFRDHAQIVILKKELACTRLKKLVN